MRLVLATVPADPAALADWLERQIAGPDLGRLIDELSALHGDDPRNVDLAFVLGDYRPAVLERGLGALSEKRLRALLRFPKLLGELQDLVLEAGTPYWDARFDQPELTAMAGRARAALLDDSAPAAPAARPARTPFYRRPWVVSLATAAAVLLAVYLVGPPGNAPETWGWNRPGVVTAGNSRGEHLTALASAAEEWDGRPKGSPEELRRALQEMRDGCTKVLAAEHAQLSPDDRVWLADRCVAWGTKLDRHLADLQTGRPVDEVRREADDTVQKLAQALRARASA
jgi:hypothetical protein